MGAAGELADEEAGLLVAVLDVGAEGIAVVARTDFDGFAAGRLRILDHQVLVVVLRVDGHLDLDQVARLQLVARLQRHPRELFDLLLDGLAAAAGDIDLFIFRHQLVVIAVDLDFQTGLLDEFLEGEVGRVDIGVDRAVALAADLERVLAGGQRLAFEHQLVVKVEKILFGDADLLVLLAIDPQLDHHVGLGLAGSPQIIGERLDAERGIAGRVPVGRVLAVVEQVLDQPGGLGRLRIDLGEQLEIGRLAFVFAAIPVPPAAAVLGLELQVGGLVLGILGQILLDVADQHVAFLDVAFGIERQAEQRLGVERQLGAVAIKEVLHRHIILELAGEHQEDQRIQLVGMILVVHGIRRQLQPADLLGLVAFQPLDAAVVGIGIDLDIAELGDLEAADHPGGGVRRRVFAVAGEPAPAAIGTLHVLQLLRPFLDHIVEEALVEDRRFLVAVAIPVEEIAMLVTPLLDPLLVVADLLGIEVRGLGLERLEIDAGLLQHLAGDRGREELVEGLLGAAIRIFDQVRQRIQHGPGQGRGPADLEAALFRTAVDRDGELDLAGRIARPHRQAPGFSLEHAVDDDREGHLHGIGIALGERLHPDDHFAFPDRLHLPVDPFLAARLDLDLLAGLAGDFEGAAIQFQDCRDLLRLVQIVVDVGGKDDLVAFDKEARRLQAEQQILAGHDLGRAFADPGALGECPGADLPAGEVFGHREINLDLAIGVGHQRRRPVRGIGKVLPDGNLRGGLAAATGTSSRGALQGCAFCHRHPGHRRHRRGRRHRHGVGHDHPFLHGHPAAAKTAAAGNRHLAPGTKLPISAGPAIRLQPLHGFVVTVVGQHGAKDADDPHARIVGAGHRLANAGQVVLVEDIVVAAPLPEDLADVAGKRAGAGDVFDRLVVDGDDDAAGNRFAGRIGDLQLDLGRGTRLVLGGRWLDRDVERPRFGRHADVLHLRIDFAVVDGQRLDVEIRHVLFQHIDLLLDRTALQIEDPRHQADAVGGADKEQDRAVLVVAVDRQADLFAGPVFLLVGQQLELVEVELAAGLAHPAHFEEDRTLDLPVLGIGDDASQPVLAGLGGIETELGSPFLVDVDLIGIDLLLDRLALLVVGDRIEGDLALAGNRLAIAAAGLEAGVDLVAGAVVAAVQPGVDLEGLDGDQDIAGTGDGAAGFVGHLGRDRVFLVLVAEDRLGGGRVDQDLGGAIRTNVGGGFLDDFGRRLRTPPRHPVVDRGAPAPVVPAGIPAAVDGQPAIAIVVEPIPAADRIPAGGLFLPGHLDLQLRLGHRPAKIVFGLDQRLDLVAKLHRILRPLDGDFEFRLLVFLDAEADAGADIIVVGDADVVHAELGIARQHQLAAEPAIGIERHRLLVDLGPHRIIDGDGNPLAGKGRSLVVGIIAGVADPGLELDFLVRAVDRTVGEAIRFRLVVLIVVVLESRFAMPETADVENGKAAILGLRLDPVLVVVLQRPLGGDADAVGVGHRPGFVGVDMVAAALLGPFLLPAEELDRGVGGGLAGDRVGDIDKLGT